ncbi:MAG: PD-(D/E)XK nuclease family protein [Clostridiales bacterium]|nr:PD-(D/E)XK nuclease family protein [Clostridiales bacterium]
MKLTLFTGRAGSGKTDAITSRALAHMDAGERVVLVIPEQFTYAVERALAARRGGIAGVEVYGQTRLCERVLAQTGRALPYLNAQGRVMLLKKIAAEQAQNLGVLARAAQTRGFAAKVDTLLGTLKNSEITPDALADALAAMEAGDPLRVKLEDLLVLYRAQEEATTGRYATEDDLPARVLEALPHSFIADCHVYVDGLDNPTGQMLGLLCGMLACAKSLTIALRRGEEAKDSRLFAPDARIGERLVAHARTLGLPVFTRHFEKEYHSPPTALEHLETYLFRHDAVPLDIPSQNVRILSAPSAREEAETVAEEVLALARSGVRYREIALIAAELDAYAPLLARAFALRGIPLFHNVKRKLLGHGAAEILLAAVDAAEGNYAVPALLRVLKSGFANIPQADAEIFENYLLRYGIYGSSLTHALHFGEVPPGAEETRRTVMEPLLALREGLKGRTAKEKAAACTAYLETIALREQLSERARACEEAGDLTEAAVTRQVWNGVCALLRQTHDILEDLPVKSREFAAMLREGAQDAALGILPETADVVTLGDLRRGKGSAVRALFFLGCRDGAFPRGRNDADFISDRELAALRSHGLPVWDDSAALTQSERLDIYTALGKAREYLSFSYPTGSGAETNAPAYLLERVRALLPNARIISAAQNEIQYPSTDRAAFQLLARLLRQSRQQGSVDPRVHTLIAYFERHRAYSAPLQTLLDGTGLLRDPGSFGPQTANRLYPSLQHVSATRLEGFSKCPFSHYIKYGLSAREREELQQSGLEDGDFYHSALDAFVRKANANGEVIADITDERAGEYVEEILAELIPAHNEGLLERDARLRESLFLRAEALSQCILSLIFQSRAGAFRQTETELRFGRDGALPPLQIDVPGNNPVALSGVIDRVDRAQIGEERFVRVVDYKLGGREPKAADIENGKTLQLPLYLLAAAENAHAAGMYYMRLNANYEKEDGGDTLHTLDGLTAKDIPALRASDAGFAQDIPYASAAIPGVKTDKNGEVKGVRALWEAELQQLSGVARRVAGRAVARILQGEAKIAPADASSCEYCAYGPICGRDKVFGRKAAGLKFKELLELDAKTILNL